MITNTAMTRPEVQSTPTFHFFFYSGSNFFRRL